MPLTKSLVATPSVPSLVTVKIDTFILQIRNLCRGRGLQIWNKTSLSDLIYKDILFLHSLPRLQRAGYLELDLAYIGIPEPSFKGLLSLKEPELINGAFKRLWKQLQVSAVSKLFDGRDFAMAPIEKKDATKYLALLTEILTYASSVELAPFDSDSGHTYFNKDLAKGLAKTFGQFYTPVTVVESIVRELNLTSKDTVLDPSCGSCSFLQEAVHVLMKKENISADIAFTNLFGVEVEPNIYVDGLMNTFTRFGMLPDMDTNIREADAFKVLLLEGTQYDKIPANPPFGADAKSFQEFYFKTTMEPKGKKLVKKTVVNPDLTFQIPFPHTGESAILFFQMIVQKLKQGGKAGVVMSSTILNDGNKDLIKWFLESCSLEKVIINPAGTFKDKGTGIETFSFIFTKGNPTTTVSIVMLGHEDTVVRTLTLAEIEAAGWKLQLKEEEKKVAYTGAYELVKLGDVVSGKPGENLPPSEVEANPGPYPVVSGGREPTKSYAKYNREGGLITLSKFGSYAGYVRWNPSPFWSLGSFTLIPKVPEKCLSRFIYYTLHLCNEKLYSLQRPGPTTNFYWSDVESLEIPIPPLAIQTEIVASLDRILADPKDSKDCLAFTSNAMDLMLKDPTGKLLEDVLGGLRLKRAHLAAVDSVKAQMAALVKSVSARGYERKKLSLLCEFNSGITKHDTSYGKETGKYPFYTGAMNNKLYTDLADIHHLVIIMNRTNGAGKCNLFIDKECSVAGQTMVLYMKDKNEMTLRYLFHYLNTYKGLVEEGYTGSNHKNISNAFMEEFCVELPPLAIQEQILAILNEMEAERKVLEQMATKAEERAKYILEGYLTPVPGATDEYSYNEDGDIIFEE